MSFGSAISSWIKTILRKIVNELKRFIKKYGVIILVCVAFYFGGPILAAYITSVGGPAWIATTLTAISTGIGTAASWAWAGVTAVGSAVASGWGYMSFGWKVATVLGTGALVDPEGAGEVIEAGVEVAVDLASTAAGAVVSGAGDALGGILPLLLVGFVVYKIATSDSKGGSNG